MARELRADGDTWRVRLGAESPEPGVRTVLFFPVTSDQRPFRVVEVPEERVRDERGLEALSERELLQLFRDASSMGFPKNYS